MDISILTHFGSLNSNSNSNFLTLSSKFTKSDTLGTFGTVITDYECAGAFLEHGKPNVFDILSKMILKMYLGGGDIF